MDSEAYVTPQVPLKIPNIDDRDQKASHISESDSGAVGLYMSPEDVVNFEIEKEKHVSDKVARCLAKKDMYESSDALPDSLGGAGDTYTMQLSTGDDTPGVQPAFSKIPTAVDYEEEFPIREGDIYKRGQSMKSWKQRHHVLELTHIDYYDDSSKQKHRGRCHLVHTNVDDILILETNERIGMHLITPTRIWRFHFMSRDLRADWYDDIIARIKALDHPYEKIRKGPCSMRKPGRLYSSWDDRFIRLDNCFNLYVYNSEDIDTHEFTIDLFFVNELEEYEEGDRNGITLKLDNGTYTFVLISQDLVQNWMDAIQAQIERRDQLLQFEDLINEPATWNVSEHARFFGDFWSLFAPGTEFPGFKSLQWGILGFGENPMESLSESGVLGLEILRKMSTQYGDELRRIFDKTTNYPRLAVCLTTFIRLYKEVGLTNHFRRIVCFGGNQDPIENMTEIAFCVLKRFDKRWRKHKFELEHLKDICEEFLQQLITCVYDCNSLRMLKLSICQKSLDNGGSGKRRPSGAVSRKKKNSFFGRLAPK